MPSARKRGRPKIVPDKSGRCLGQRPPREDANEMGAIFGACMNVAVHTIRRDGHSLKRLSSEALLERFFERLHAKHAIGASTCDRDADIRAALGYEDADQRKAGGRMLELLVGRFLGDRETDLG